MWNELASYKNHFLQSELKESYKAEHINEMVKGEFKLANSKRDKCKVQETPKCKHSTYFHDRAQLAYGWFALPKLMRELCSGDSLTEWRAIKSLTEFLLNPLNAQRAITEMDIIRKVHNALMRFRKHYQKEEYHEVEELMRIFYIISNYLNGAEKIAPKNFLMAEFYTIIRNREGTQDLAAKILRNLTEKPAVLLYLEKTEAFERLCGVFLRDKCQKHFPHPLWVHLGHFLELSPERGLQNGLFELFHSRIVSRQPAFHRMNMKMFGLLLRCAAGQAKFNDVDGVKMLYEILTDSGQDTYEFLMFALLHGLHSKEALWRAREFMDMPAIIVDIAKVSSNARSQLYCLQVLRQLAVMPCLKRFINLNYGDILRDMPTANQFNECHRDDIMAWFEREIYDTSE